MVWQGVKRSKYQSRNQCKSKVFKGLEEETSESEQSDIDDLSQDECENEIQNGGGCNENTDIAS